MQIPTNPMYDIDEQGVVRLISTSAVIPEYINHKQRRAVKIRGISHKPSSHPLDRLMLCTYKPLPGNNNGDWWSVKFLDGNRNNVTIENLEWDDTWYTPALIPGVTVDLNTWVSFYGYPEIELRLVSHGIAIRNSFTRIEIGYRLNKDGYALIVSPVSGEVIRLHRLVALTFLSHPLDTDHLTVNHKDSNKNNNTPFNLEWATYSENNVHSFSEGPRGSTIRKIKVLNLETSQEKIFSGYNEAARYLGVRPGSIHSVMDRRTYEGRPYKGYIFKYDDDLRSWEELRSSGPTQKRKTPEKIACKNMVTGNVNVYNSFAETLEKEGINSHTLFRLLSNDHLIPWRYKCFQEHKEGQTLKWPVYPKEILKVYEKVHATDRPIKVTNLWSGVKYYTSVTEWCAEDRSNRCDPAVLSRYLKKSNRWKDWVFEYIDLSKYLHE